MKHVKRILLFCLLLSTAALPVTFARALTPLNAVETVSIAETASSPAASPAASGSPADWAGNEKLKSRLWLTAFIFTAFVLLFTSVGLILTRRNMKPKQK